MEAVRSIRGSEAEPPGDEHLSWQELKPQLRRTAELLDALIVGAYPSEQERFLRGYRANAAEMMKTSIEASFLVRDLDHLQKRHKELANLQQKVMTARSLAMHNAGWTSEVRESYSSIEDDGGRSDSYPLKHPREEVTTPVQKALNIQSTVVHTLREMTEIEDTAADILGLLKKGVDALQDRNPDQRRFMMRLIDLYIGMTIESDRKVEDTRAPKQDSYYQILVHAKKELRQTLA